MKALNRILKRKTEHVCSWRQQIGDSRELTVLESDCVECNKSDFWQHFKDLPPPFHKWHVNDSECATCCDEVPPYLPTCGNAKTTAYSDTGFLLKVDIKFPEEVKKYLSGFPPLSVNSKVTKDDLSDEQISDYEASGFKFTEGRKLCPTLENYEDLVLVS